jgi:hypothetical protein
VPGYNTTTELRYLERVGQAWQPDLVIVGFYENDLADNDLVPATPTLRRRVTSGVQAAMQRWLYSYELYKRIALTARWQWFTSVPDRARIEALAGEEALMVRAGVEAGARLSDVDKFSDAATFRCPELEQQGRRDRLEDHLQGDAPSLVAWRRSVAELQRLNRDGAYRIVFFINMAPNQCPSEDRFVDAGAFEDEAALRAIMEQGTPVFSSARAFLPYRPSQMPGASGHSTGNANRVKADALFDALTNGILPGPSR